MDLKQLEYFVRVAELGSFTRASIALDIAQPALSRQIRQLEVELRQNLLIRNGRGVNTTEAGKLLLEHARGVLHQVERTREELSRARGGLAGRVALGMPPSLSRVLCVALYRSFRQELPEASLAISEGLSSSMQEQLISGRLDIALLYNTVESPDLELTPLLDEELFLVSRPDQAPDQAALPLQQLADYPLVIPTRPNTIRMQVESALSSIGERPRIALEIDGISAILELVDDGAGHAILPGNALSPHPGQFTATPFQPAIKSTLMLAVSSRRPVSLTQKAVIKLLKAQTRSG